MFKNVPEYNDIKFYSKLKYIQESRTNYFICNNVKCIKICELNKKETIIRLAIATSFSNSYILSPHQSCYWNFFTFKGYFSACFSYTLVCSLLVRYMIGVWLMHLLLNCVLSFLIGVSPLLLLAVIECVTVN